MAEIRSTLDMVMARAAKMCDHETLDPTSTNLEKGGMRLAAAFLRGDAVDIPFKIKELSGNNRLLFIKGISVTFLRNLLLPRDTEITCQSSLHGLLEIGKATSTYDELGQYISEIQTILTRYIDHRSQLKNQLKEHFASQMAQLQQNLSQQTGMNLNLDPANHPKFAEEWQKHSISLQEQYSAPLEQYKAAIKQIILQ